MSKFIDLTGKPHGKFTPLERVINESGKQTLWRCLCAWGNERVVAAGNLRSGAVKSCGCDKREIASKRATKHGLSKHPAYESYSCAKQRCTNPKHKNYGEYGRRGIEFRLPPIADFWATLGDTWFEGATLERIDNNGHYELGNVRWATRREQCLNTRNSRKLTLNGVTKNLCQWAEHLGINQASLRERLRKWPMEKALTTPKLNNS